MDTYQKYIAASRYARYLPHAGRRETWQETVDRYMVHVFDKHANDSFEGVRNDVRNAILDLGVMPSMRAMMTAGPALERDHVAGYNCSYLEVNKLRAFSDTMYILLCGTGVGFSVERRCVERLPAVGEELFIHIPYEYTTEEECTPYAGVAGYQHRTATVKFKDSKIGWATGLYQVIALAFCGVDVSWDLSNIRPAGAPLKVFGGRASGPIPLDNCLRKVTMIIKGAKGRKLRPIEAHDIMCHIAEAVVVGGVRRSAMISLSDPEDREMALAKSGEWWVDNMQRRIANNSAVYNTRPDRMMFDQHIGMMVEGRSGERGIINRAALTDKASSLGRVTTGVFYGVNPCGEIILRPQQFCNLSEVVARPTDSIQRLADKVAYATLLGTIQAGFTDFRVLSNQWRENCEEEALLGVSITGVCDHPVLREDSNEAMDALEYLRSVARETNLQAAATLGINQSASITCVKPSGTVSQLVDSSSGIHGRFAPHYIRRVQGNTHDPLVQALIRAKVPHGRVDDTTVSFEFPKKSPEGAKMASDMGVVEQLQVWKQFQDGWCDHNPSCSIYYRDSEVEDMTAWVWKNFDALGGLSFFPRDDHVYQNAPYEAIGREEYEKRLTSFPDIGNLKVAEDSDGTEASQTYACTAAGGCEL